MPLTRGVGAIVDSIRLSPLLERAGAAAVRQSVKEGSARTAKLEVPLSSIEKGRYQGRMRTLDRASIPRICGHRSRGDR